MQILILDTTVQPARKFRAFHTCGHAGRFDCACEEHTVHIPAKVEVTTTALAGKDLGRVVRVPGDLAWNLACM
jgi:hypothetical protein